MKITNIKIYTEEQRFEEGELFISDGRFAASGQHRDDFAKEIDGKGCYAIPGLIDLHFHGCAGADFCDGTAEAFRQIAEYEASVGVTSIAPATMTLPLEELERILSAAANYVQHDFVKTGEKPRAEIVGINMEGPFISKVKKGAQDAANILPCSVEVCERFLKSSDGLVKFIGLAPEESENVVEFIRAVSDRVNVSLAHTNADYRQAFEAFQAGANHAVHLYNAMSVFSHREPGVIGAVADCGHVMAELICDGVHLHPATVRTTFKMLGKDRIIFISDSMRATGLPDGIYTLGGLNVRVSGNRAALVSDGALAGSVTNLMDCMRTAVQQMKIPLETAVACATINPARSLGIEKEYGSIAPGKVADLVLLDEELRVKMVMKRGVLL